MLRAWDNCGRFREYLKALPTSKEWVAYAEENKDTLAALRAFGYESFLIGSTKPCGIFQHRALPLLTDWTCTASATYLGPIDDSFFRAALHDRDLFFLTSAVRISPKGAVIK